ncbi:ATP-binding cassette domain-containing protein [Undibacterium piscinae]|uniref:ATP-binding cassette domain-containing protein n=1 Tax=Undibacterium piscinae TaxID=2495591 RepID=A0A6M4AA47_9BURK|nr:ATP-binding cassette domain-containing protein [Undibacterium piscinae]
MAALSSPPRGSAIEHSTAFILQLSELDFAYPQRPLFKDFSARIPAGVSLIRGGDGVGKSSLLRLLAGDLEAQRGQFILKGIALAEQPACYRQQVFYGYPQALAEAHDQLSPDAYFASVAARYPQFDAVYLAELIVALGLSPHMGKTLYMLSTGVKRKVWLAAAFASGAALTLLDDPFAALDLTSTRAVLQILSSFSSQTQRAIVYSHYEQAAGLALACVIDLGD